MGERIYLHPLLERIWHGIHALCILMLILSGAQIHWPEWVHIFGGFQNAISVHNCFGLIVVGAFFLWLFYNLISLRITHYLPNRRDIPKGIIVQARFYAYGIFKHEPHPYSPSLDEKFNPLQKVAYFQFMFLMMPLLLISGVLYLYPIYFSDFIAFIGGLMVIAIIHFIMAVIFTAFFIAHVYLATTGHTVLDNFIAMITGYGMTSNHNEKGTGF
ncbi:MAG: cytochrome B [Syntrophobacteraceae bacterium CG23_combo_of_CG06-09_8_20_14_all_50_8]|nr:MAG: cytochrome B [Syntrophobacteraceae bacterium CG23_combo_of_CG06-09_8_20_14_all_50_8]